MKKTRLPLIGRAIAFMAVLLVGIGGGFNNAHAQVELGLTPSHVFSLWTNTNNALETMAGILTKDSSLRQKVKATTPRGFTGKKPADVLRRVAEFREKLDRLRQKGSLPPTKRFVHGTGTITPSVVFLNSGHVLDATVQWVIKNSGKDQLVSPFYVRHDISGKTPSDAFAMVDLANRRIDMILFN